MKIHTKAIALVLGVSLRKALSIECGFCPDGHAPQKLDALYNDTMTCGEVHDYLAGISNPDECVLGQATLILSNFPAQCGYCDVLDETGKCTLCADGSIPSADAAKITWTGASCGPLAITALFDGADSNACSELQAKVGSECGCPPVGPRCSVCADHSPIPNPKAFSKDFNMSCNEIEQYAKQIPEDTEDCSYFRNRGMIDCGCLTAEPQVLPADDPTAEPTLMTWDPTFEPSSEPTSEPTLAPEATLADVPTKEQTTNPTIETVTTDPTIGGTTTSDPSQEPSIFPSYDPSNMATGAPTDSVEISFTLGKNTAQDASDASGCTSNLAVMWLGISSILLFVRSLKV